MAFCTEEFWTRRTKMTQRPKLLFLTNFSEACYQAIPAAAEWIDRERGELTILHVHGPEARERRNAFGRIDSFFAEADRYENSERLLLEGETVSTIVQYCNEMSPDLVFAPASKPKGISRLFRRSMRAQLLQRAQVRLWTRGRNGVGSTSRAASPANVVYAVSGHAHWRQELRIAAQTAEFHKAKFHLLWLTPHQEIVEGALGRDLRSGPPNTDMEELLQEVERMPVAPEIHRGLADEHRDLRRFVKEIAADLVFAGDRHVLRRGFAGAFFDGGLDRLDCEVICFPERFGPAQPEESPEAAQIPLVEWQEN
jgi:nucleotide-binding universal stress UspA family protein